MGKPAIKRTLFTIASLIGAPLISNADPSAMVPIDRLPTEQRTQVYEQILKVLLENPSLAQNPNGIFTIDNRGTVYEVDKRFVGGGDVGSPSTAEGGN